MATGKRPTVGVRELRQNLSVYLRRVKRGVTLLVTDHGHVVAELRPVPVAADVIERLARDGLVTRATRRPADLPAPVRRDLGRPVGEILDELRKDRV